MKAAINGLLALAFLGCSACGQETQAPQGDANTSVGIERSVEDVRMARADAAKAGQPSTDISDAPEQAGGN